MESSDYVAAPTSIVMAPGTTPLLQGVARRVQRHGGSRPVLALLLGLLAGTGCGSGSSLTAGASPESVATAPRLLNGEQIEEAIAAEYPEALRREGVGGTVRLRLLVGTDGIPTEVRLLESSDYPALDEAATRVAVLLRFSPATDSAGNPLRVWASFPISFPVP